MHAHAESLCDQLATDLCLSVFGMYWLCICCRMTVVVKEESLTLYKDQGKNIFTAVVFSPGTVVAYGQVFVNDLSSQCLFIIHKQ